MTRRGVRRAKLRRNPQVRKCEWCSKALPSEKYRLRICPDCRKATIEAFRKGELEVERPPLHTLIAPRPKLQL